MESRVYLLAHTDAFPPIKNFSPSLFLTRGALMGHSSPPAHFVDRFALPRLSPLFPSLVDRSLAQAREKEVAIPDKYLHEKRPTANRGIPAIFGSLRAGSDILS